MSHQRGPGVPAFHYHYFFNTNYAGASAIPIYATSFEFGYGPIHMTLVRCTGTEIKLVNCGYSTSYFEILYFCDHYYDAAVRCQRGTQVDSVVEYSK